MGGRDPARLDRLLARAVTTVEAPAISVVVSARDAAATIDRAVGAMVDQRVEGGHEVVVVDNASNDDTGARAEAAGARVLRLEDRAGGPGQARNRGVAMARAALIAFTDADCFPAPGWLDAVRVGLLGGELVSGPVLPDPEHAGRGHWDRTVAFRAASPLYPTANLAVTRRVFEQAGGFSDWVLRADGSAPGHPYGEDTVLAWGAIRAGARPVFVPEALVHHAVFPERPTRWIGRHTELRHLPRLVRQIPELREELLLRGVFSSRRTAAAELALAGAVVSLLGRRPEPLLAAAPLGALLCRRALAMGPRAAAIWTAADVVSAAALIQGSASARTLVL